MSTLPMQGLPLSGAHLIFFANTILALGWSLCILIGLYPFKGLLHAWFFRRYPYNWGTHIMMGWFDVGCWALFAVNLQALMHFRDTTGAEAFNLVYGTNAVAHGLWGAHNLHQFIRIISKADEGTYSEWRRPWPMLLWSLLGACGSGFLRNTYALWYGVDDYVTQLTIGWEWLSLLMLLTDFVYFVALEHTWGMALQQNDIIAPLSKSPELPLLEAKWKGRQILPIRSPESASKLKAAKDAWRQSYGSTAEDSPLEMRKIRGSPSSMEDFKARRAAVLAAADKGVPPATRRIRDSPVSVEDFKARRAAAMAADEPETEVELDF